MKLNRLIPMLPVFSVRIGGLNLEIGLALSQEGSMCPEHRVRRKR